MSLVINNIVRDECASLNQGQAFGIRLCPSPAVVQMAQNNGYDAVFIDLEHSVLSEANAGVLCTTALLADVTPFVRVPYQCGNGFVQRVLDCGAMGVIFPHIHSGGKWDPHQHS